MSGQDQSVRVDDRVRISPVLEMLRGRLLLLGLQKID